MPEKIIGQKDSTLLLEYATSRVKYPDKFLSEVKHIYSQRNKKIFDEVELSDGRTFERYSSAMMDKNQKYYGRIWFFRDITHHKKAELTIQKQNVELTKLDADKNRFISILAHDLKSPFQSILGFLDLLGANIHDFSIDEIEEQINIVNSSSKNVYKLIENTLLWVNANSGKIPFEPETLHFFDVYNDAVSPLQLQANNKKINITYKSSKELKLFIDRNMISTVLRNLVSNAIKFTKTGGKIDISIVEKKSNSVVTVADNGVGIKDEILKKLFCISDIVTTKGTKNESGTGLGLLLCKEFVEIHGGKIWVTSKLNVGTKFIFTLPINYKEL